jgi:hypothetical protein
MSEENNNAKMSEAESPADGNKELSEHARDLGPRHEVRGVGRSLARGHGHHTLRQAGTDGGLAAGPVRVFLQALHAQRQETLAPSENVFRGDRHAGGDLLVRLARGRKQHDASALRHSHRERSAPGLGFQSRPFLRTQRNGWGDSHPQVPSSIKTLADG